MAGNRLFLLLIALMTLQSALSQITPENQFDASGYRQGLWQIYRNQKNGKKYVSFIGGYKNDLRDGRCTYFREDGKLFTESFYIRDTLDGESRVYREDGSLYQIENYKMGKVHGWRKFFNNEGKIVDEQEWQEGIRHGLYRSYHPSGRVASETYYVQDIENGIRKIFADDSSNHLLRAFEFADGKMVRARYYENGVLTREVIP